MRGRSSTTSPARRPDSPTPSSRTEARLPRRRRLREDGARRLGRHDLVASGQRHERHEADHGRGDPPAAPRARPLRRQPRRSVAAAVVPARGRIRHRHLPAAAEPHVGDQPAVDVALRGRAGEVGQRLGRPEVRRLPRHHAGLGEPVQERELRAAPPRDPGALEGDRRRSRHRADHEGERRRLVPRLRPAEDLRPGRRARTSRAPSRSPTRRPCSTTRRTPPRAASWPTSRSARSTAAAATRTCACPRSISRGSWRTSRTASS